MLRVLARLPPERSVAECGAGPRGDDKSREDSGRESAKGERAGDLCMRRGAIGGAESLCK